MRRQVILFVSTVFLIGSLGGVVAGVPLSESTENETVSTAAQEGTPLDSGAEIVSPRQTDSGFPAGSEVPIELKIWGESDVATLTFGYLGAGQNARFDATVRDSDGDDRITVFFDTGDFFGQSNGFRTGSGAELIDTTGQHQLTPEYDLAATSYDLAVSAERQPYYVDEVVTTDRTVVRLTDEPADESPTVTVEDATEDDQPSVRAGLFDLQANQQATVPVAETTGTNDTAVSLTEVAVTPTVATAATVNVTTSADPLADTSMTELPDGTTGLRYLSVETDLDNAKINQTTFQFEIDRSALEQVNSTAEAVTLARYDENSAQWVQYDPETVRETERSIQFQTTVDRFSEWAIAAMTPQFEVTNTDVDSDSIAPGGTVTVEATITNTGGVSGTHEAVLTSDSDTVGSESISLESGASQTVEFTYSPSDAGEYSLAVDGTSAGSVAVESEESTEQNDTEPDSVDGDNSESSDSSGPGFGVLVALAALLSTGYLFQQQKYSH